MLDSAGRHKLADIFGAQGILAKQLAHYEARSGQEEMATAVWRTLCGGMLAVEAGTGTGKTLAYLVPAVLSGQKVVVSTATLNLQDQILHKEIPFLREHIDPELTALCVKGRQNYLCLHRFRQVSVSPQQQLFSQDGTLARIAEWLAKTTTGDRAELGWLPDDSSLWPLISSTTTQCLAMQCPEASECFISRLRREAARARLLVVNHHLFFSDLALRRFGHAEVLPRYESVIFDEAHHLENVATRYFGVTFSQYQLQDLVADLEKEALNLPEKSRLPVIQTARSLAAQAEIFATLFPRERGRFPLLPFVEQTLGWQPELQALLDRITSLSLKLESLESFGEAWSGLGRRSLELGDRLRSVTERYQSTFVYWYERRDKTIILSASPIEVASHLRECLYNEVRSAIFTSATLTTGGEFTYFTGQLGVTGEIDTLCLPTPYDYSGRTLLYIPDQGFPAPGSPGYFEGARNLIYDIILAARGRTLVLFTSISAMQRVHEYLLERLPYSVLVQGAAPRAVLLEGFRQDTHSVLLAVASFWEGVDVPGEALSCVIVDKLPFEVPSDPVIMARVKKIEAEGGNPFVDLQVPRAILTLRQGLGRLLRSAADRGVLAILDVRLFTKQYGSLFRRSLPASPVTREINEVRRFFEEE